MADVLQFVPRRPACPRCQPAMIAAERVVTPTDRRRLLRVGNPVPPRPVVRTWRCERCGLEHTRFS